RRAPTFPRDNRPPPPPGVPARGAVTDPAGAEPESRGTTGGRRAADPRRDRPCLPVRHALHPLARSPGRAVLYRLGHRRGPGGTRAGGEVGAATGAAEGGAAGARDRRRPRPDGPGDAARAQAPHRAGSAPRLAPEPDGRGRRASGDGARRARLQPRSRRDGARGALARGGRHPLGQGALAERRARGGEHAGDGARRGARKRAPAHAMTYDVTLIPGDGIGPEITAQTVMVLEATGLRFNWDEELAGMAAVEATGTPLPDATVESIRKNALALKGPLTTPVATGFRSVNVGLRKEFELFANVRPAKTLVPGGRFENVDIVMVRENLEGLYVGVEHFIAIGDDPRAVGESMAI